MGYYKSRRHYFYFKDSGEPVGLMVTVSKVVQFENLTPHKVAAILGRYAQAGGLGVNKKDIKLYIEMFKNRRYYLLVFLKNPQDIEPFDIDKSGFGARATWMTVDGIDLIRKNLEVILDYGKNHENMIPRAIFPII